jgi:hypothetical protein
MKHTLIGLTIGAILGIIGQQIYVDFFRGSPIADRYMEVHSVTIPDHILGDDPLINYERTIHKTFLGRWQVQFKKLTEEGVVNICHTDWYEDDYTASSELESRGVELHSWYSHGVCKNKMSAGEWIIKTIWVGKAADGQEFTIRKASNVFEVTE